MNEDDNQGNDNNNNDNSQRFPPTQVGRDKKVVIIIINRNTGENSRMLCSNTKLCNSTQLLIQEMETNTELHDI